MPKNSAGLIMYRQSEEKLEVLLVHPGGPFWAKKDKGAWSIPKGEHREGELPLLAAIREFQEETGFLAHGDFLQLGFVKQKGGKLTTAWAFAGDCTPAELVSNTFKIEWPPKSGKQVEFSEVDRGCWFSLAEASEYIHLSQQPLLQRLSELINNGSSA